MLTRTEVALLRLVAQRVVGPRCPTATETVRHLCALQAQDFPAALAAVTLRTEPADDGGIVGSLDRGEVVRSWPMRGTLHLVAAEDLSWMQSLTTDRLITGAARRRAQLGIDDAMLDRALEVATAALSGGRSLSRSELMTLWNEAGLLEAGQRGYHLLWNLAQRGFLCLGPTANGEQRIVLLHEWVPEPRQLEREEALGEWVLRYFRGHGPATLKDFTWWTKLTVADAKIGLAVARPHLESVEVDGVEHLMDPTTPELLAEHRRAARGVVLLPAFDEMILGYQDRSATLPPEHADRIVPGGNGMFRPIVVSGGRVVGTWRRVGNGSRRRIETEPFATLTATVERGVTRAADSYPELALGRA
ncbi:winged helix DNA-binding protein [Georgenia soli]|uniref:Winged helix DNA-binding protein n=1 Tax=Georgenia soli TaxID=638953 RepID=A0A2A9EN80_9MICO|nr:winged helix DNA-binding domain-containing protein [Georgenia soli]PFG39690.1 winged helix DNA-binding protein [Georgenia soli]